MRERAAALVAATKAGPLMTAAHECHTLGGFGSVVLLPVVCFCLLAFCAHRFCLFLSDIVPFPVFPGLTFPYFWNPLDYEFSGLA